MDNYNIITATLASNPSSLPLPPPITTDTDNQPPPSQPTPDRPNSSNRTDSIREGKNSTRRKPSWESIGSRLNYFCLYSTKLGGKEEEQEEQILYYGTRENLERVEPVRREGSNSNTTRRVSEFEVSLDTQLRQVGLAQALVTFTKTFSTTEICENVHSKKARLTFYEPEPDYFMIMSVALEARLKKTKEKLDSYQAEYLDHELSDLALKTFLIQAYQRFRLGHGTLDTKLKEVGPEGLRTLLNNFFDGYLSTALQLNKLTIVSGMNGLPVLSISKATFLLIQSTLNQLHTAFPSLEAAAVIHRGYLVWSGIQLPTETISFLTDLTRGGSLLDDNLQLVDKKPIRNSILSTIAPYFFRPPSPLKNQNSSDSGLKILSNFYTNWDPTSPYWGLTDTANEPFQKLYLGENGSQIYHCGLFSCWSHAYLALFFPDEAKPDDRILTELEMYLCTQNFTELESNVTRDGLMNDKYRSDVNPSFQYLHYNGMNMALNFKLTELSPDVHALLLDVQTQLLRKPPPTEILLRTAASPQQPVIWVGARSSSDETLYFVIKEDVDLADIEERISLLSNEYFTHLFID